MSQTELIYASAATSAATCLPHRQRRFGEGDPQTALLDCCSDGGTAGTSQGEQALPGLSRVPKRACTSAQHSTRLIAGAQHRLRWLQPGAELLQSKVTSTVRPKLWKITLPTLPGCRQHGWELQSPPAPGLLGAARSAGGGTRCSARGRSSRGISWCRRYSPAAC